MEDIAPQLTSPGDPDSGSATEGGTGIGPVQAVPPPRVLRTVFSRRSLSRCIPIAGVVGTVLSAVNQGSVIFGGKASTITWIRVGTNYLTPFIVSSSGYFASQRSMWRSKAAAGR
jgi:hypothetical protein